MSNAEPEEKIEPKEKDFISRITEFDRISTEGPTLKNAVDSMRSLITCAAMILGTMVFLRELPVKYEFYPVRIIAIFLVIWTVIYTLFALFQFAFILMMGIALTILEIVLVVSKKARVHDKVGLVFKSSNAINIAAYIFTIVLLAFYSVAGFVVWQSVISDLARK